MNPVFRLAATAATTAAAFAAGMLAMYLMDEQSGRRRRALWRDKVRSGARSAVLEGQRQARHVANRTRGLVSTRSLDRHTQRAPHSDHQLHERIRSQLGRLVSHPHAVHVHVAAGIVTLTGPILRHEVDSLLDCLRHMAGVARVDNHLEAHAEAGRVPELQGGSRVGAASHAVQPGHQQAQHAASADQAHEEARAHERTAVGSSQPTTWH